MVLIRVEMCTISAHSQFGVVNNITEDNCTTMNAYLWQEGEVDRGANNICSCLLQDFKNRGFLKQHYGSLTIIADNCRGQNKNKHVVCFLMWMVEMVFFPKITLFFLVKGHTKNACNQMFNLLKLSYHHKDIFTFHQLLKCVNENDFVSAHRIPPIEMKDFLKW